MKSWCGLSQLNTNIAAAQLNIHVKRVVQTVFALKETLGLHTSPDTVQSQTTNNLFRTSPTLFIAPVRGHGSQHQLLSTVLES